MPRALCDVTTAHICSMNDTIYRITLYNKAIYRYISYTTYRVAGCTPVDGRHLERMPVILSGSEGEGPLRPTSQILRCAQGDKSPACCHPERSEGSRADL